jgi:recombination protein RecR
MLYTSEALQQLIEEFSRLPGIGRKSAQRIALFVLKQPREEVVRMAKALVNVKDRIRYCSVCCNITLRRPTSSEDCTTFSEGHSHRSTGSDPKSSK